MRKLYFIFILLFFTSFIVSAQLVTLPYNQSFISNLGDCTPFSVVGSSTWYWSEDNKFYLRASGPWDQFAETTGYETGGAQENWLILPGFSKLDGNNVLISFDSYFNYGEDTGGTLELYYSTDYSGSGTPVGSTWINLSFVQPPQKKKWYNSESVTLPASLSGTVYFAFKYESPDVDDNDIRTWRVDNISIVDGASLPEPDNYPTNFTATAQSASNILTTWTDAIGTNLPTGYLILASDVNSFDIDPPIDGTSYLLDKDLSDGKGNVNIFHGGYQSVQWTGLDKNKTYYFKIYSYSNTGTEIDYKTNGTPPIANAKTFTEGSNVPRKSILIAEFMAEPGVGISDAEGEWFELYNTTGAPINLNGWILESEDNGKLEWYSIVDISGEVWIKAESFLVFGLNGDRIANGGVPVGYEYENIFMDNVLDTLRLLTDGKDTMNYIEWGGPDGLWDIRFGQSLKFIGKIEGDNNYGLNWSPSFYRENGYENDVYSEDPGSPGTNGLFQNLVPSTTWTGTGKWTEGNLVGNDNWTNGSPGSHVDVTVNGTLTVDLPKSNPAKCGKLIISDGKTVTILPGTALTTK